MPNGFIFDDNHAAGIRLVLIASIVDHIFQEVEREIATSRVGYRTS